MFTDLAKAEERVEPILKLELVTEGAVRKGTVFRETRVMFGKEHTEEMTISDFSSPESYTVKAGSCGAEYTSVISFTPENDGTTVSMEFTSKPTTLGAWLMSPLGFLMKGTMVKMIRADFEALKAVAESG